MNKEEFPIELIKKKDEVILVANLVLNLIKSSKVQFILLKGDIGSGKTTLVKEIAKILGETSNIISPTFNKMFVYQHIVHIDAYYLDNQTLDSFEDYFEDKIVIIEWAEKLNQKFQERLEIEIIHLNDETRKYMINWKK